MYMWTSEYGSYKKIVVLVYFLQLFFFFSVLFPWFFNNLEGETQTINRTWLRAVVLQKSKMATNNAVCFNQPSAPCSFLVKIRLEYQNENNLWSFWSLENLFKMGKQYVMIPKVELQLIYGMKSRKTKGKMQKPFLTSTNAWSSPYFPGLFS